MEEIKYNGNANGMTAESYANSIVPKLMKSSISDEIWEGKLAWMLRFLVTFFPQKLVVCAKNSNLAGVLADCSTELDTIPPI